MIYLVKVTIQPTSSEDPQLTFKKLVIEGVYIPVEGKRKTLSVKIEEQCKAFILGNLKRDSPELEFEFKHFNIRRYNNQFTINDNLK